MQVKVNITIICKGAFKKTEDKAVDNYFSVLVF